MVDQTFTNLDFENVKISLKNYLKAQDRFKDYDFEGSNMNVLLDVLAYNTFQNNFYTNMAISEMFLDSAQIKDSVVSHAKELNYLPRSRRSANANLRVQFFPTNAPATISIPRKTKFTARCGTETFTFYNDQAYTARANNGQYIIEDVIVYEGRYLDEFYTVTGSAAQKFLINNNQVDTQSIRVFVKANSGATAETEYTYKSNIFGVNATDKIFYLQPVSGNRYEVVFGDNQFGSNPSSGNIVRIEYRVTRGEEANGIQTIDLENQINGISSTETVTARSQGGAERESIDSIKFYAPKSIQIQERAVTESDYEVLLKNEFPEIQAVSAYGGETLNPPQYGRVIISVDIQDSDGVSENAKTEYTNYLKTRSPLAIEPRIVSAEFMYISIDAKVYYDTGRTNLNASAIESLARSALLNYSRTNLDDFNRDVRFSKLASAIDNSSSVILSNDIEVRAIIDFNPVLGTPSSISFTYGNGLYLDPPLDLGDDINRHSPAIKSSEFTYQGKTSFFQDDGRGAIKIISSQPNGFVYLKSDAGTIDYDTGQVTISSVVIDSFVGSSIKLIGNTRCGNIFGLKDRIVTIRDADININVTGN
jgi:hypothetical protein